MKKLVRINLGLLLLFAALQSNAAHRLLLIGDSHTAGDFGYNLHLNLQNSSEVSSVYSIGISGAGSYHYTLELKNRCCGYRVMSSNSSEPIPKVIEEQPRKSPGVILKADQGLLSKVINRIQPDYVLIGLGHNMINAHAKLIELIRSQVNSSSLIWIGPPGNLNINEQKNLITSSLENISNAHFVTSDDLIGRPNEITPHFYGEEALTWAEGVFQKIEPLLEKPWP